MILSGRKTSQISPTVGLPAIFGGDIMAHLQIEGVQDLDCHEALKFRWTYIG